MNGTPDLLEAAEHHFGRGELEPAIAALLPVLHRRAEAGDRACALAARLLRARPEDAGARGDPLAPTVERLIRLVQRQEEQIRTLRAALEETL